MTPPTAGPTAEPEPVRDAPPRHTADEPAVPIVTARIAPGPGGPASTESDTTAADQLETYLARIRTHLDGYKEYPEDTRQRGEEGTTLVWLVIDRAGRVIDYRIEESSGYSGLDREAREMIRRAEPFPAMPNGMERSHLAIHVPVRFRLR